MTLCIPTSSLMNRGIDPVTSRHFTSICTNNTHAASSSCMCPGPATRTPCSKTRSSLPGSHLSSSHAFLCRCLHCLLTRSLFNPRHPHSNTGKEPKPFSQPNSLEISLPTVPCQTAAPRLQWAVFPVELLPPARQRRFRMLAI